MQIEVQEEIQKQPRLAGLVEQANKMLEEEIGPSRLSGDLTAAWSFAGIGHNGKEISLRLSNPYGSFAVSFSAEELGDQFRREGKIRRVWDNVLAAIGAKHLARLREIVAQLDADEKE